MKFNGPKVKLSRRLGLALTPKAARVMERKANPPGQHGGSRRRRPSNYAKQLLEKQRLKAQYNISERHFRKVFKKAKQRKGSTGENLVTLLECRLDALVLRSGLATTIYQARQSVAHGHVLINGKKCDIPSVRLRAGDRLSIRERSRKIASFNQPRLATVPSYLQVDDDGYGAQLLSEPPFTEVPIICDVQLIVEFYSR